jgi:hypothetical protein
MVIQELGINTAFSFIEFNDLCEQDALLYRLGLLLGGIQAIRARC